MQPPLLSASARKRVLVTVFLTVFLDMIGFGIVIPLLPLYVTAMHASALTVGFVLSSFSAMQLVATPMLGRLSDRYGRRRIILLSLAGNALSMIVFALATRLSLLPLLFLSRILAGATAGNISACQAAIADTTPKEERAGAMGMLGAALGLGMVVGPVIAGAVSQFGPAAPPLCAAALALGDLVLALFLMPETRPVGTAAKPASGPAAPRPSLLAVLQEPRMAAVLALSFLTFISMSNMQVSMPLLAKQRLGWEARETGYGFALFGLIMMIIQGGLLGRLVRALGELGLIIAGAVLMTAGLLLLATAHQAGGLLGGIMLTAAAMAVVNPSLTSLASRLCRDDQMGAVLGFVQSAGGLARTIGPTWSGLLFGWLGAGAPFVGGAIASLLSLSIALAVRAAARGGHNAPPR